MAPVAAANNSLLSFLPSNAASGSRPPYCLTRSRVSFSSAHWKRSRQLERFLPSFPISCNFVSWFLNSERTFEFSLNNYLWIQQIQWIMTKSKSSMVTRDILYLTTIDTFLDVVVKKNFPLLSVGWYLFRVVRSNRYLSIALITYLLIDGFCHDSLNLLNSVKFI